MSWPHSIYKLGRWFCFDFPIDDMFQPVDRSWHKIRQGGTRKGVCQDYHPFPLATTVVTPDSSGFPYMKANLDIYPSGRRTQLSSCWLFTCKLTVPKVLDQSINCAPTSEQRFVHRSLGRNLSGLDSTGVVGRLCENCLLDPTGQGVAKPVNIRNDTPEGYLRVKPSIIRREAVFFLVYAESSIESLCLENRLELSSVKVSKAWSWLNPLGSTVNV